jgi:hypothetical protein
LDKKLDSMLENKSKNTAKVLSSNSEQSKIKGSKNGVKGKTGNSAPIKTLDDFFNPLSNRVFSGDLQTGIISSSEGLSSLNFGGDGGGGGGGGGGDDNESSQSSIMQSVFRHIMR